METDVIHNIKNYYSNIATQTPLLTEYQFLVTLIAGNDQDANWKDLVKWEKLQLFCQSAQIPQKEIQTAKINYFGKSFDVPTSENPQHQWTTSIILTNDMIAYHELRKLMLKFSSLDQNMGGVRTVPNIDIVIDVLNQFSQLSPEQPRIILRGCYPKQLDSIPLKYQESAEVMKPNVTFIYQYSYFTHYDTKNGSYLDVDSLERSAKVIK